MEGDQQRKQPQPDQPTTVTGVKRSLKILRSQQVQYRILFLYICTGAHTHIYSSLLGQFPRYYALSFQYKKQRSQGIVSKFCAHQYLNLLIREWKLNMCAYDTDTDGLDVMKLIYGIKGHGIQHRRRRESKVYHIATSLVFIHCHGLLHTYMFFLIAYTFFDICTLEYLLAWSSVSR